MVRFARSLIAIAIPVLLSGCAAGPGLFGSQTGTVTGHVMILSCGGAYRVDQNGCRIAPAEGVAVMLSKGGGQPTTAKTDAGGNYRLKLAPGAYAVTVGFVSAGLAHPSGPAPRFSGPSTVTVRAGQTVTANFTGTIELL